MKTVVVSSNSPLFKFACSWGRWNYKRDADICAYRRALLCGVLKVSLIMAACLLVYGGLSYRLYSDLVAAGLPFPLLLSIVLPGLAVAAFAGGLLAVAVAYVTVGEKWDEWRDRRWEASQKAPITPLRALYRSWKDKLCAKVEVE